MNGKTRIGTRSSGSLELRVHLFQKVNRSRSDRAWKACGRAQTRCGAGPPPSSGRGATLVAKPGEARARFEIGADAVTCLGSVTSGYRLEDESRVGESPGANRCGASALGIEPSVFRLDESMGVLISI